MTRTYRALTTLALSLALVATTAAVAGAAEDHSSAREALYQSELEQNLTGQAARSQAARTEAAVERARALERQAGTVAAQPVAEDQNDRLLRGIEAAQAERTQAAVEQARAGERNLVPVVTLAAPQPGPGRARPRRRRGRRRRAGPGGRADRRCRRGRRGRRGRRQPPPAPGRGC